MSTIDDYLEAREDFARATARIQDYARELSAFAGILSKTPHEAYVALPAILYTREEVQRLLSEAMAAFDRMNGLWGRIPPDARQGVSEPLRSMGQSQGPGS